MASNDVHEPVWKGDDLDMEVPARILSDATKYTGAIFSVHERRIALTHRNGDRTVITRQVIEHAPCVVMLVHDTVTDRYLVEREYRAGSDLYAYGLPAGLIDAQESPHHAALRELREETGVVPDGTPWIDHVGDCYSSEGMTDELAHISVIHLDGWHHAATEFDPDEHVESAWVSWQELKGMPITASNSVIAIQHEELRRLRERLD